MKSCIRSAALALGLTSLPAFAQQAIPVWQPHVDIEAKPGTKRNIGEADFFLPVWQDGKGLLFGNARLRIADHDNREGNLGLGYRRMLEGGWNFGGYGYYDRRRSTTGNYFNQVTLGAEALGRDWDFRGNVYLPQGDRVRDLGSTTTGGGSTAAIVGSTVQVTTAGSTTFLNQEQALKGYDVEAGWRAPVWAAEADKQLRLYAGGYHFSDNGIRVSGPRVRAELTMAELPALWKGAQLILGAEYQDDNARGGQGFVSARLRIPLGSDKNAGHKMNWQERRMAAPVVRDVDVVTQSRATAVSSTPAVVENATATAGGQAITVLNSGTTTGAALPAAVAAAGANSTVVLTGTYNTTASTVIQAGQTLMGAGPIAVRTPSGYVATLNAPGATINGGNIPAAQGTITMANNSTLRGMTINDTEGGGGANSVALITNGVSGAVVTGNTITANGALGASVHGITFINSSNITVSGNTITATGGSLTIGVQYFNTSGIISNNSLSASGSTGTNQAVILNGGGGATTVQSGSTGNNRVAGVCFNGGTVNGSVGFADGTTCP